MGSTPTSSAMIFYRIEHDIVAGFAVTYICFEEEGFEIFEEVFVFSPVDWKCFIANYNYTGVTEGAPRNWEFAI